MTGERVVAATAFDHVILRTAWVYAPYGKNFVRTMLALAQTRDEVRVVADQLGCPTYAADIALAIIAVAHNLLSKPDEPRLRGIFNLAGSEETNWADFAATIFAILARKGVRTPVVTPISSADYPTAARRHGQLSARLQQARARASHRTAILAFLTEELPGTSEQRS